MPKEARARGVAPFGATEREECERVSRVARFATGLVALSALSGCSRAQKPSLHLVVGTEPGDDSSFAPEVSFAEYVSIPGDHDELRITVASYAASCERFVPPGPGQALVTVVVTTPAGDPPHAASYPWNGPSDRARAAPSARVGPRGYVFPPGGSLTLTRVELEPQGSVAGWFDFEFPGSAETSQKSLHGRFEARLCRFSPAP